MAKGGNIISAIKTTVEIKEVEKKKPKEKLKKRK